MPVRFSGRRDVRYQGDMLTLVDMRGVRQLQVDVRARAGIVAIDREGAHGPRARRTASVADDPLVLAKLEVYKDLARDLPGEIALFIRSNSAIAWSGVPAQCVESFPTVEAHP